MKKFLLSLLFIFICSAAHADLVYTYKDSSGNWKAGSIAVTATADATEPFDFEIYQDAAGINFNKYCKAQRQELRDNHRYSVRRKLRHGLYL